VDGAMLPTALVPSEPVAPDRAYEALDLEGHRWRFLQGAREMPRYERRGRP